MSVRKEGARPEEENKVRGPLIDKEGTQGKIGPPINGGSKKKKKTTLNKLARSLAPTGMVLKSGLGKQVKMALAQ